MKDTKRENQYKFFKLVLPILTCKVRGQTRELVLLMTMRSSCSCLFASTTLFISLHVFLLVCYTSNSEAVMEAPRNNMTLIFPAVFASGDSIVDQGNNHHLRTQVKCNFPKTLLDILGTYNYFIPIPN